MLTACIDQDDAKTASLCINLLHKRSHVLDEGTLTAALHTAARRGDVDLMQLAWAGLLKAVGGPSPAAHLARIQALTMPRPWQGGIPLERLFQELAQLEVGEVRADAFGYRLARKGSLDTVWYTTGNAGTCSLIFSRVRHETCYSGGFV